MDNTNLIMRAKIGVHNQSSVSLDTEGYDQKTLENTVRELKNDGYEASLSEEQGKTVLVVKRG